MDHREGHLQGARGRQIFWQSWRPDSSPRTVVVIAHGASEHSDRYRHVADRVVAAGHAVYALDHRGHGRSEGPRALIDRMANAVADLDALVVQAAADTGAPAYLLGHSMGGAIALNYAFEHQDRLAGLILSGAVAALEAASPAQRIMARTLSALVPRLPLFEIDSTKVSRDPEVVRDYRDDPLVYHGKLPVRTVAELAAAVESFPARVPEIACPTLIMFGTADSLCPPEGSRMVYERIGAQDKTLIPYEGLYHEIFNEPERERVMDDLVDWLSARSAQLSGQGAPGQAGTR